MNFLQTIVVRKRVIVEESKRVLSLHDLRSLTDGTVPPNDFKAAIYGDGGLPRIIAEMKRASPSKGVIAANVDPSAVARDYKNGGAAAISVLTEGDYFAGSTKDLQIVRENVPDVPILRKDFIIDEYQVYESVLIGADALLLIVAALEPKKLRNFIELARSRAIATLVEVHDENELDIALSSGAEMVGVNNRNLVTFELSHDVSERLAPRIPRNIASVSESGIKDVNGLNAAALLGYHAVLIGEHFMRSADRVRELKRFTAGEIKKN